MDLRWQVASCCACCCLFSLVGSQEHLRKVGVSSKCKALQNTRPYNPDACVAGVKGKRLISRA